MELFILQLVDFLTSIVAGFYSAINTQDTAEAKMTEIQDRFLAYLSPGSHILDLGCGTGRDSKLFLDRQYKVTALDGSPELCKTAKAFTDQEIRSCRIKCANS